jgi:hypothetical protein
MRIPERVRNARGDDAIRAWVARWLKERRSLLAPVQSQVLPEADVVLMNPLHLDAARVRPLVTRPSASPSASTFHRCSRPTPVRATLPGSPASGRSLLQEVLARRRRERALERCSVGRRSVRE